MLENIIVAIPLLGFVYILAGCIVIAVVDTDDEKLRWFYEAHKLSIGFQWRWWYCWPNVVRAFIKYKRINNL